MEDASALRASTVAAEAGPAPADDGAPVRVLYVMGHAFSGSTLLTLLLGCHAEVATVGELGVAEAVRQRTSPDRYLCSCRVPIRRCEFWAGVRQQMAARGRPFDPWDSDLDFRVPHGGVADALLRAAQRGPLLEACRRGGILVVPGARRRLSHTLDRIATLARVVTELRGAAVFVDASKRPERAVFMQRDPRLDVRVLHLVRDGRAVVCSTMRNRGWSAGVAATSWLQDNRRSELARRYFPADRWTRIRHEDLCADVGGTLARIHRFAGVTPCADIPRFREKEQHVIGNRMRLDSLTEIRADERWRTELDGGTRRLLERRTAWMNRRYGYPPD